MNAASYQGGSVAPGEIITIFGSGMGPALLVGLQLTPDRQFVASTLAETRVTFDGAPAPVIYASEKQVSVVVPYGVGSVSRTEMRVEYRGAVSDAVMLPVTAASPAIFTLNSSGSGQAAVLNQDYSMNGFAAPAPKGSVLTIFATGGGELAPRIEDGRVVGPDLARTTATVSVQVGTVNAEVLYAGAAPGLVNGVLQINIKVPENASGGVQAITLRIGSATTQAGATVVIAGRSDQGGSGPTNIQQTFDQLKRSAELQQLPEIPNDLIGLPTDWLGLVSWNIQTGGTSVTAGALRPPMVRDALTRMFGGTYQILAAEEIPSSESAEYLRNLLPGGATVWSTSFFDSTDTMDNGNWFRTGVTLRDSFTLFTSTRTDSSGRYVADTSRAEHPPHVAQFEVNDFDFTLITVHLTFADGKTAESARRCRTSSTIWTGISLSQIMTRM